MAKHSRAFAAGTLLLVLLLVCPSTAPYLAASPAPARGTSELQQLLIKLHTTARLMHTIAHPDDEDGGMLVLEARGEGVTALQLTLTRGEGGQNRMGSNLFDELGCCARWNCWPPTSITGCSSASLASPTSVIPRAPRKPSTNGTGMRWRSPTWCG